MSLDNGRKDELFSLLEALCEQRLTAEQAERLEELVVDDAEARRLYLNYIALHGSLYWDLGAGAASPTSVRPALPATAPRPAGTAEDVSAPIPREPASVDSRRRRVHGRRIASIAGLAAAVILGLGALYWVTRPDGGTGIPVADPGPAAPHGEPTASDPSTAPGDLPDALRIRIAPRRHSSGSKRDVAVAPTRQPKEGPAASDRQGGDFGVPTSSPPILGSDQAIVEFINDRLRSHWRAAGLTPSPRADDAEWIRRVYLDLVGHIPPAGDVKAFLRDTRPDKRQRLVERLLDDEHYVRHWTTLWANRLVGRSTARDIDRPALEAFLRRSFARNRPWSEIVADLIAAEGPAEKEGAANFLLAHLNNQAVPATAITARILLGRQLQCAQCHDHPFNDWTQDDFWQLNSFFMQTARRRRKVTDPATGRSRMQTELVTRPVGGPIFFENRRGALQAAYPVFAGTRIPDDPQTNRRRALAELLVRGPKTAVAEAFVNRTWADLFGYGFTRPVDDMGSHNPPTHPELLDRLAREFVASGYDVKRLIRWITACEAYQLTSRFNEGNTEDDPARGEWPLFSRMYVRPMSAEQVFDSLLVATGAEHGGGVPWSEADARRRRWLQQFVIAFDDDENDEAVTFEGTISQALMMMNSEPTRQALDTASQTLLGGLLRRRISDTERIRELWLAALSRYPTEEELASVRRMLREAVGRVPLGPPRQKALAEAYQDLLWALLNSTEFSLVH